MADVRSMLKSQRSARRIQHPAAVYTTKGQLSCSLCRLVLKSESQWEAHLRSEQHGASLRKKKPDQPRNESTGAASKKRKAPSDTDSNAKRIRSEAENEIALPPEPTDADQSIVDKALPRRTYERDGVKVSRKALSTQTVPDIVPAEPDGIDHEEWAAFERDMQGLEDQDLRQDPLRMYGEAATISAQPMAAAELAARDREEKSRQRGARDRELEDERDEAQEQLQEEFDRMQQLDERIKELREKKEALTRTRVPRASDAASEVADAVVITTDDAIGESTGESDSEDDVDEWGFGSPNTVDDGASDD